MPDKIVINTTCRAVEKKEKVIRTEKVVVNDNEKIMQTTLALGWFALFEGSWEWLYVGAEPPPFKKGDRIKITIEACHERA